MQTTAGPVQDALEQPFRRARRPVVLVPGREQAEVVIIALHDLDDDARPEQCRIVAPDGILDALTWDIAARAADLVDRDQLAWRQGDVTDFGFAGPAVTAAVITSVPTPVVHVDDGGGEVAEQFHNRWDSSTPVEIDTPPLSAVRDTLDSHAGQGAAEDVDLVTTRARCSTDPVAVLLWAAAGTGATVRAVTDAAAELGLASRTTVYRRLDSLTDAGIVRAVPDHDGERGRPDRTLHREIAVGDDEPLPAAVQTALQG